MLRYIAPVKFRFFSASKLVRSTFYDISEVNV